MTLRECVGRSHGRTETLHVYSEGDPGGQCSRTSLFFCNLKAVSTSRLPELISQSIMIVLPLTYEHP